MAAHTRPLFSADWPRYAVAAQIAFWASSALFLAGCIAGFAGFASAQAISPLFFIWILTAIIVGATAVCSGMLYIGKQVFARTPTTGWSARIAGAFAAVGGTAIIAFAYLLSQAHG